MARKISKARKKIGIVIKEFTKGKLKSSSGRKITSRKQAIAIGLSEARQAGARIPKRTAPKAKKRKR